MPNLIEKTPSFSPDLSKPGFLIILMDSSHRVFASGIILETSPILLRLSIWSTDTNIGLAGSDFADTSVVNHELKIDDVVSGQTRVTIIDPKSPHILITESEGEEG